VKPFKAPKSAAPKACSKGEFLFEGACYKQCGSDSDCAPGQWCQDFHSITEDGRIGGLMGQGCDG
jgi:hypothetical protein